MDEPDKVRRSIGLRIIELRRERKLTQEDFAERLGIDVRHLRRVEAGKVNFTIDTIVKLANALKVATIDLFTAPNRKQLRLPGRPRTTKTS